MSDPEFTKNVYSAADLGPVGSANVGARLLLQIDGPVLLGGGYLYFPPGPWPIDVPLFEVPAFVTLWFAPGAVLEISSLTTVVIGGDIIAGSQRIFDTSTSPGGTVQLLGKLRAVYPEWWGAAGGPGDDRPFLQSAIDAVSTYRVASDGRPLPTIPIILSGVYAISNTLVINHPDSDSGGPSFILMRGAQGDSGSNAASIGPGLQFPGGSPLLTITGPGAFSIEDVQLDCSGVGAGCVQVIFDPEGAPESNRAQVNSFARCSFTGSIGAPSWHSR